MDGLGDGEALPDGDGPGDGSPPPPPRSPVSYAPVSQPVPCGRGADLWSSATSHPGGMWSIAGLPFNKACVSVGPPLSARLSIPAAPTTRSFVSSRLHDESSATLSPTESRSAGNPA